MIYTYLFIFIANPLICILALLILFKLFLRRVSTQLSPRQIKEILKKILPPDQIAKELFPIAEEIEDILPKLVPGWIKFLGRRWYRKIQKLVRTLGDEETMKEIVEAILEGEKLPEIITKNLTKRNPGIQRTLISTLRPWIILVGILLGILIGVVQVLLMF